MVVIDTTELFLIERKSQHNGDNSLHLSHIEDLIFFKKNRGDDLLVHRAMH